VTEKSKDYQSIFNQRGHLYNAATSLCPTARDNELAALLDLIHFQERDTLCDAPAGGGFVAEGVRRLNYSHCPITCFEPAENFAAAISSEFDVHISEVDKLPVKDGFFSIVTSLAGLHHVDQRQDIFNEWRRVITPTGQCVVADVATNTGIARFLNGFVNEFCPGGHEGLFFEQGEFSHLLDSAGFEPLTDQLETVPWRFKSQLQMGIFCKGLFGLQDVTSEQVAQALHDIVGTKTQDSGQVQLLWQLQYAKGIAR